MSKMKKTIAVILCLIMAVGSYAFADEAQLISAKSKDYEGHWAQAVIEKWLDSGKASGYPDGSYKPDNNVTRAEFVKMVDGIIDFNTKGEITYSDVPATEWYYDYIGIAQEIGYISGYSGGKFGPDDYITREQAASILARIQYLDGNAEGIESFNDKDEISSWAAEAVGAASKAGFISGYSDGSFRPSENLTRAEAVTMLDNVLENGKNHVIYNAGTKIDDFVYEGGLVIAETVGDGDVTLNNVTVKGDLKVLGGGENSLYFNNVKIAKIIVSKEGVRLVLGEGTEVQEVEVASETILENTDGTVAKIIVTGDNTVTLKGEFEEVAVTGNADVTLDNAVIAKLVVEKPVVIKGIGTITTLEANADGIEFEAKVEIKKTVVGEGVTQPPAEREETSTGGGSGPSGDGGRETTKDYKISVSAVIEGTEYKPLITTSAYTGTDNISTFLRDEAVEILNTGNAEIAGYFTKFNNKLSNLKVNGVQVNTTEGLAKIKEELSGTSIVDGFSDGIFSDSDSEISETEMKAILNAYVLTDLDELSDIDLTKTAEYGEGEITPTFKVNDADKTREEFAAFITAAGNLNINNFFSQYGTAVEIEVISGSKTASFTITKVE